MTYGVVYKATRRKGVFSYPKEVVKEVEKTLDGTVKRTLIRSFDKVVADWESDVSFAARKFIRQEAIWVNVFPQGSDKEVFRYVDKGTRPHRIEAKNYVPRGQSKPRLVFEWGGPGSYSPKTRPPGIFGLRSGAYGPLWFFGSVNHPGNEARKFSETIGKAYKKQFRREIRNAIRRGKRKARRF